MCTLDSWGSLRAPISKKNLWSGRPSPRCRIFSFPSLDQLKQMFATVRPYPRRHPPIKSAVNSITAPILLFVQQFMNSFEQSFEHILEKSPCPNHSVAVAKQAIYNTMALRSLLWATYFPAEVKTPVQVFSSIWRRESRVLFLRGIFLLNLFMTESVCTPVHSISDRGTVSKFPGVNVSAVGLIKKIQMEG